MKLNMAVIDRRESETPKEMVHAEAKGYLYDAETRAMINAAIQKALASSVQSGPTPISIGWGSKEYNALAYEEKRRRVSLEEGKDLGTFF